MAKVDRKTERALNNSVKDGAAHSAMTGITGTYSTPFALALGASTAEVGLLNSIPTLFSTILQPFARMYFKSMGTKDVCVSMGFLQRLTLIPMIFIPIFFSNEGVFMLILLATLSQIFLSFSNTAWSSLIGSIVPEKVRGRYFGSRNMYQGIFSFSTTLLGGWLLGLMDGLRGFSFVFFLAFAFGMVSYMYLSKIPPVSRKAMPSSQGPDDRRRQRYFKPFTRYMALVNFAVNLASPFFIVYMLSVMNVGYEWYGIVIASEMLVKIAMQKYWGAFADKFGDRNVMILCGIMTVFYPFFFLFVRSPVDLVLVGIFSGVAWSGFDLASFNYLLDVTPSGDRSSYITSYKLLTGITLFLGPLVGGLLSEYLSQASLFWLGGLQILFLTSFLLRGGATLYGITKIREVRGRTLPARDIFLKAFVTYPLGGMSHQVVYLHHKFGKIETDLRRKI